MAEYKDFVKEFAARTKSNLDFIKKAKTQQALELYEFTQLVNSLFGLLVIPQQRERNRINDDFIDATILTNLQNKITRNDYPYNDFAEILRHMRNALAHGTITISSPNGYISAIEFTDKNPKCKNKQFSIMLTNHESLGFVYDFSSKLNEKL